MRQMGQTKLKNESDSCKFFMQMRTYDDQCKLLICPDLKKTIGNKYTLVPAGRDEMSKIPNRNSLALLAKRGLADSAVSVSMKKSIMFLVVADHSLFGLSEFDMTGRSEEARNGRRAWDEMDEDEWEAYDEQMYEERIEELKQTLRLTSPCMSCSRPFAVHRDSAFRLLSLLLIIGASQCAVVFRQIGVMMGVSLFNWFIQNLMGCVHIKQLIDVICTTIWAENFLQD